MRARRWLGEITVLIALLGLTEYGSTANWEKWRLYGLRATLGCVFLLGLDLVIDNREGRE